MMLIFGLLIALAHGADSDDGVLLMQMRAKMMAETETTSDWQVGDGSGGSETRIGDASSRDECEGMCTDRAATDATINGCTYSNSGGTGCFVEIGMTGHNGNSNWQTQCLPGKYCGEDFPAPAAEVSTEADTWQVGDGSGGSETRIGDASSKDECEGMCTDRAATDSTINGCTYSNSGGTGCFVEIGMTGHNGNSNWQTKCLPGKYCGEDFPTPAPEAGPSGGFVFATGYNSNCQQVCATAGGTAVGCGTPYKDQSWFHWDNSFEPAKSQAEEEALAIFKANGFECPGYHWSGSGFLYESSQRKCYIPEPGGNVLCNHAQSNYRQMCYCDGVNGYPNIEETTTTTTTANPAWDNFVFGNTNQNCNQVCAAAGGECSGEGMFSEQAWYHNFGWTDQFEPAKSQAVKEALAIFRSKGFECPNYVWSGSGFLYETTQQKCYIPTWNAGYSCGHAQTNYRQMCYCGPEQTTTTTTTTADPDWAKFVLANGFNQDCNQVCAEAGGECSGEGQYQDQSWYKWDDTTEPDKSIGAKEARAIFKSKGFDCPNSYDKWSGSGFVFESRANECYWPVHNAGYRCDMRQTNYRNMCRCSGGVFDPTTTTTTTTAAATSSGCSLGPPNNNGECPAGSTSITSAADCEACKDGLAGYDVDDYSIGYKPEDIWWASSGNWGGDVKGCYLNTQANSLYFNVATTGAPSPYMRPVCGGGNAVLETPAPTPAKVCRSSCHKGDYIKKKSCSRPQCSGCCECTGECVPKSKPRREKKCKDKCYRKRGDQSMKKHMCHKNKCGGCPECINPSFLEADENDEADDDDVDDDDVDDDDDEDLA